VTDFATYLRPAFMAGAVFLLVVGGGILLMMRLRFPLAGPATKSAALDLCRAGLVIMVFGIGVGVAATWMIASCGTWILAVPAALVADGVAFALVGRTRSRP
jgi:hypothetical protein